ncbi:predicted protein, partial [Nematostella vectensis]
RRRWSDKVQDFQIRVKILEGRQLSGNNIHPVVRVAMSNQKRETKIVRSTNKPVYNESFTFNFHTSEAELFDDLFSPAVSAHSYWRWGIRPKKQLFQGLPRPKCAYISSFAFLNVVFLFQGYLKVTAMVLGPGDEPPIKAKLPPKEEDEDDIESNCLMPMGVARQPALFNLRIFQAEDIPQMDSGMGRSIKKFFKGIFGGAKGLVDPYVKVNFCGKKIETSIKYQDDNPEFKEQVKIPLMFPSMCERIKIQLYDWDRVGNDDCIGTAFLSLSSISGQGDEGNELLVILHPSLLCFPPTFGPCFVNFYGSPREFSELPDQDDALNKGIGEGVAYRGRVLIELETTLGSNEIEQEVSQIETEDIVRVQPFLRREKYKLFACFYEATMIKDVDGPVEFEVSIGNYGNKMDESVAPANTAPSNPLFDGCHYNYLPWGNEKPVVVVESFWEDIAFRLEPLNLISRLCDKLEVNVKRVRSALDAPTPPKEDAFVPMVTSILEVLISDCIPHVGVLSKSSKHCSYDILGRKVLPLNHRDHDLNLTTELKSALDFPGAEINMEQTVGELNGYLQRLRDVAIEPQNCIPDVIVWMISGSERIAYYRIPAQEVLFSTTPDACGKICGKTVELRLKYPGKKGQDLKDHPEIPALVRVELWFGHEKYQDNWTAREKSEGDFIVYAETYENEIKIGPVWTKKACPRPGFSSPDGELELPPDKFIEPSGWKFLGDWEKKPELSLMHDKDSGRKTFVEELYEQGARNFPGGEWGGAKIQWTDVGGDQTTSPQEKATPPGWVWASPQWVVDKNRAVDGEGWEYTVDLSYGVYSPVQKAYHLSRRRRWVRRRDLKHPESTKKQVRRKLLLEGWEYAPVFTMKFHAKERKMDFVRRRRMMRKLIPEGGGKIDPKKSKLPPILRNKAKGITFFRTPSLSISKSVISCTPHKFQMWAYVYQARDLLAKDESGMNDPYVRVAFANQSQMTEVKQKTLCPTWDQTLIFHVDLFDSLENIQRNPPTVVMELFDKDQVGKDDFLGRTEFKPYPRIHGNEGPACKLLWYPISHGDEDGGEILAACELFLVSFIFFQCTTKLETGLLNFHLQDDGVVNIPHPPTPRDAEGEILPVRDRIRPVLQKTVVEVLCWGVRNMKKYQLASIKSPSVQFEIGGEIIQSDILTDAKKFPNFGRPILPRKIINLPVEEMYTPPMNIRIHDNRTFGRKPTVAVHSIKSLTRFRCAAPTPAGQIQVEGPAAPGQPAEGVVPEAESHKFDWWSKYYASLNQTEDSKSEKVGDGTTGRTLSPELEKIEEFGGLEDMIASFSLYRGKAKKRDDDDEETQKVVGEFKGTFRIYPLPEAEGVDPDLPETVFTNLPPNEPIDCVVRVYILSAIDLQPQDPGGLADPYVVVQLGKKKLDNKDQYKPNTLNPIFGKMFELDAVIPVHKDLKITLMDYDLLTRDDMIGETVIDLEQRLLTRYRAKCGIPKTYCDSGPNQWRDHKRPMELLREWCEETEKNFKFYKGTKDGTPDRIVVGYRVYQLDEFGAFRNPNEHLGAKHQRLALHVLNQLEFIPEHVETRGLRSPMQPNIEQGKVQLWVDIFPKNEGVLKPSVDITAREPTNYELRVIVWNTSGVIMDETSITGEQMSDIYVKGWLEGMGDDKEKTDVHYRSLDGDGNFNWRMVFNFLYLPIEKKMVIREKEHFWSLDAKEVRLAPRLNMQIWDNDTFSYDDFLGSCQLDLIKLPKPCQTAKRCGTSRDPGKNGEYVDLFQQHSIQGWWACYQEGIEEPTGKIEMTIEVLNSNEAAVKPAGKGRDEPNQNPHLDEPNRPATSFLWFTSPFKTLKYIIWRNYKWLIIGLLILIVIIALVVIFVYSMPVS